MGFEFRVQEPGYFLLVSNKIFIVGYVEGKKHKYVLPSPFFFLMEFLI